MESWTFLGSSASKEIIKISNFFYLFFVISKINTIKFKLYYAAHKRHYLGKRSLPWC
jgi:hypothetical protein